MTDSVQSKFEADRQRRALECSVMSPNDISHDPQPLRAIRRNIAVLQTKQVNLITS